MKNLKMFSKLGCLAMVCLFSPVLNGQTIIFHQDGGYSENSMEELVYYGTPYNPVDTRALQQVADRNTNQPGMTGRGVAKDPNRENTTPPDRPKNGMSKGKIAKIVKALASFLEELGYRPGISVQLSGEHVLDHYGNVMSATDTLTIDTWIENTQIYYRLTVTNHNGQKEWAVIKGEDIGK